MEVAFKLFAQLTSDQINVPKPTLDPSDLHNVLQVVFGFAGAIAFIVVVVAGLQYVLSQGNPQATSKAKNTILYALIGLIVCILAFSIVNFVVGRT